MAALAALAPIVSAVGTLASAAGSIAAGKAANENAQYQAAQYEIKADEELAQGSRETEQKFREMRRAQSRLQAVSAADGGSATDPTVIALDSGLQQEGSLQALMSMATAEGRAAGYEGQASASIATGQAEQQAGYLKGFSTLASGFGDLYKTPFPTTVAGSGSSLLQKYG